MIKVFFYVGLAVFCVYCLFSWMQVQVDRHDQALREIIMEAHSWDPHSITLEEKDQLEEEVGEASDRLDNN